MNKTIYPPEKASNFNEWTQLIQLENGYLKERIRLSESGLLKRYKQSIVNKT